MIDQTAGFDVEALADEMRSLLADSETVYFAALRRNLAEIDIEQGDASAIDLEHVIRGEQWDRWFEARRMVPTLTATLAGIGIDLRAQRNILLDVEPRPMKSPRAFCAGAAGAERRAAGDAAARRLGRLRGADARGAGTRSTSRTSTPAARGLSALGDNSLTEGYGMLFERLVGEPEWLRDVMGMPDADALAFADFSAFWYLRVLRFAGVRAALRAVPAPHR